MATNPSRTGSFVFAAAWAIGALPSPASLEKAALLTPHVIAYNTVAPAKPPVAAVGVNACLKIR